ncbi:MAG: tripartite tricarboxylate transporter TctB family protein [Rhodospirillales bacterium]|nr:tripartite tricarboxylate transporter TctB family protein [Rhodospirillales bacterium]
MQKLLDRNLLTALVLFGVSWMFSVGSSSDPKDWAFPLLANYVTLGVAVILLVHFFVSLVRQQVPDQLQFSVDDRTSAIDVLVFLTFVLAFMFVMYGLGFWLSSLIMLIMASLYLTLNKTRRSVTMAVVVPIGICITAFLIFTYVFYVPFPEGSWLPEAG